VRRALIAIGIVSLLAGGGRASAAEQNGAKTGNLIVLLARNGASAARADRGVRTQIARVGARLAGKSVPQIGLVTVRPPGSTPLGVLAAQLRLIPGVASVEPERKYTLRLVPNDPALTAADPSSGVLEWTLRSEDFYNAWNITKGDGATVGVIDTGIDASHPDLSSKIAALIDQQTPGNSTGPANTDQVGHGTHVASLACGATGNGFGMAGAGYDCRLVVEKSDLTESSIDAAIVDAANRGVQAINMSFGSDDTTSAPESQVRALQYAAAHNVVLVAAAANTPDTEQGDPANVLQPAGTGPNITAGLGLDVTAAQWGGTKASFAGYGSEISLAAYGAFEPDQIQLIGGPPPGIFGAFPANPTQLEGLPELCGCRTTFRGTSDWAYLEGTSMAAPQVAATAAMMRTLNPFATLGEVLRTLKQTAQRPAGTGWTPDLGWGVLDAGAALDAIRRVDHQAPTARVLAPRVAHKRTFIIRLRGHDATYPGLISSGIAYFEVYVSVNGGRQRLLARTSHDSIRFHARHGRRYTFSVIAVDHAGNRQAHPAGAHTRVGR
jgi:serine protease